MYTRPHALLDQNARDLSTLRPTFLRSWTSTTSQESLALESLRSRQRQSSESDLIVEASQKHDQSEITKSVSLRFRMRHFTWAWYTLTMSTGGIATLLTVQPHEFEGLIEIGVTFYLLNLALFAFVTAMMLYRLVVFPADFKTSLQHERESLFLPTLWLSIATIINGSHRYANLFLGDDLGTWFGTTVLVAFWIYFITAYGLAVVQYSFLFARHTHHVEKMMPSWLLPIFPIMLAGTVASVIADDEPVPTRMPILVGGLGAQGLGFLVSMFMYPHLIGRLIQTGFPNREHRPALFIGVGPPSFTALAIIGMAESIPSDLTFEGSVENTAPIFYTIALALGISLWALAFWFLCVATLSVCLSPPKHFHLGWWAIVFPNTGFATATIDIGDALDSEPLKWAGTVLTILLVLIWCFVLVCQIRAVRETEIMYPGKDEDVSD